MRSPCCGKRKNCAQRQRDKGRHGRERSGDSRQPATGEYKKAQQYRGGWACGEQGGRARERERGADKKRARERRRRKQRKKERAKATKNRSMAHGPAAVQYTALASLSTARRECASSATSVGDDNDE